MSTWSNPTRRDALLTFHLAPGESVPVVVPAGGVAEIPDELARAIHTVDPTSGLIVASLAPQLVNLHDPRELSYGMKLAHPELAAELEALARRAAEPAPAPDAQPTETATTADAAEPTAPTEPAPTSKKRGAK